LSLTGLFLVIALPGHSQTFTVLHSFTGGSDGRFPDASLIRDSVGNLYGTTDMGGPSDAGTVFKVTATGAESVLYSFTGGADGGFVRSPLIRVSGDLYGTAQSGIGNSGVIFKIDTAGKETVLHTFSGKADGAAPSSG